MSYSLQRLVDLLGTKKFVPNNYFTLNGKYAFIEVIGYNDAVSVILLIDQNTTPIPSEHRNHEYSLLEKDISSTSGPVVNELDVRSRYREIDHISKELETESQLQVLYSAKPISLVGDEDKTRAKFAASLNQLKRFKLCFSGLPYKISIFDGNCICINEESGHKCYFAADYKNIKRRLYVTTTLEHFYEAANIGEDVNKILSQFYSILDDIQQAETNKIQKMIDTKHNFTAHSKRILAKKKDLSKRIADYQAQHQAITDQIYTLSRKKKEVIGKINMGANNIDKSTVERQYLQDVEKLEEKRNAIIAAMMDVRKHLDEITLIVDSILYENMTNLTQIEHSFRVLEKVQS